MRVLLLVSDSRPAGKSGGRAHFAPGYVDVDEKLAREWIDAGLALNVIDGAVGSSGSLCAKHTGDGRSCSLPLDHKGGRHFDYAITKDGENVGAGWWNGDLAVGATVTFPPSTKPCPTIGCTVGTLGHGGDCVVPTAISTVSSPVIPAAPPEALTVPSVDAESEQPARKGKG